jgi:hypothetical protein
MKTPVELPIYLQPMHGVPVAEIERTRFPRASDVPVPVPVHRPVPEFVMRDVVARQATARPQAPTRSRRAGVVLLVLFMFAAGGVCGYLASSEDVLAALSELLSRHW